MQLELICVGQRSPAWVNTGFNEYAKRLPSQCALHLREIPLPKRIKAADIVRLRHQEGQRMLATIAPRAHIVAIDERGQAWNTVQLANILRQWLQTYPTVALLVGGPDGLAPECLQQAQQHWSLSALTLPHYLVRIIVAEQLYRAWSLLNHHPYHRD